jgi:hypothetical protein
VVTFRVVIPNKTWFGLVLGSQGHENSDMIVITANGNDSRALDCYSTTETVPAEDANQSIGVTYTLIGNEVIFVITRALDTNDSQDFVLSKNEPIPFGWACNGSTSVYSVKHEQAGYFTM